MWKRFTGKWQRGRGGGLQGQVGGRGQGGEHAEYDAHVDQQEAKGGGHCYCSLAE